MKGIDFLSFKMKVKNSAQGEETVAEEEEVGLIAR